LLKQDVDLIEVVDVREPHFDVSSRVQFFQGELSSIIEHHPSVMRHVDVVFHLSWASIPESSTNDPLMDLELNVPPTLQLLQCCVTQKVNRIIFLSSGGAIYGIPDAVPITETHTTNPISAYGVTKLMVEKYLSLYHRLYGLQYTILRPSVPYGEFQNVFGRQGAVAVFLGKICQNQDIEIWGNPSTIVRDFFHADDLARACWLAANSEIPTGIFNIGGGVGVSLAALIDIMRKVVGSDKFPAIKLKPERPFDVPQLVLDTKHAKDVLDWSPQIDLETGISRMWEQLQTHPDNR
jgi:UDP-glucose 4-epimerase